MTRRLLLSYLSLMALVLLLFAVPLGLVYARSEQAALATTARRNATDLAVAVGESLQNPTANDLNALTSTYRRQTGTEVSVYGSRGEVLIGFDPAEPPGLEPDATALVGRALRGETPTARRTDDSRRQLVAAAVVRRNGQSLGAVAVAVSAASTDRRLVRTWALLAGSAAALLGFAALIGYLLARSISAPLVSLQQTAKSFGRGQLDARAPGGGPPEIAALADEFNAMADRIRDLLESQRRFVADASHQLRAPLTALRLRLENLAEGATPQNAADFAAAEAESHRLAWLVNGLLALARADDHRRSREPIDVVAIVQDRREAWAPLAEERGVSLVVDAHQPPVAPRAVPGCLEQILDNLLSNALEASPPESEIVMAVVLPPDEAGGGVVVHVRDHGPGMTDAERERAFDRFWQGRDRVGGTGLGLAIAQQLAQASGGRVELLPADGGGLDAAVTLLTR